MSGRHSRNKGARGERELKKLLEQEGFTDVVKVIGSGAHSKLGAADEYSHDVKGYYQSRLITFEVKWRENDFKTIFRSFFAQPAAAVKYNSDPMGGDSFYIARLPQDLFNVVTDYPLLNLAPKSLQKALGLKKLLKGADVLALRINHAGYLFMRFV